MVPTAPSSFKFSRGHRLQGRRGKSRTPKRMLLRYENESMLKHFDIDTLDPGYGAKPSPKKGKPKHASKEWIRLTDWQSSGPGVRPEKMQDWRSLERRAHQLMAEWKSNMQKFWTAVDGLPRPNDRRRGDRDLYVAIDDPQDGHGEVLRVSDDGYSSTWQDRMLQELFRNPDCYGDFTFVPYDDGGREVGRLYRRSERLIKAHGLYKTAFHRAVESRLARLDGARAISGSRYQHLAPVTFVVCNEDRCHVVTSDPHGGFIWRDGDVLIAS